MSPCNIEQMIVVEPKERKRGGWRLLTSMLVLLVGMAGCATPAARVRDTSRSFSCVVVDAGHGGHDNGARCRMGSEKDFTLDMARRLQPKLADAGFRTVMTRSTDRFIELDDRVRISNGEQNAVFVSIHFNDARRRGASGIEVHYKSGVSEALAQNILREMVRVPGTSSRGVRVANFRVLRLNQYPAVLIECGFLSNRDESRRCASAQFRERLAEAIAEGIRRQRHGG